ncbi:two component transcriptional regulator, LuxR family [Candidatus Koribacter versatilis Ellin345]|uniref:Two component transcriptional regulator, LuxR family n=1 Tax=Koribacter versatilis (strain Ellin345) TaxID=204669 RepID=Q1IK35_KORVE|nr:response regulator transcription factor [Candidatus Koribacter versatilis]ABF42765.1 two component transcriptional regulator, LuxR family [Candidatus Koribacter versatilis Ellin345]
MSSEKIKTTNVTTLAPSAESNREFIRVVIADSEAIFRVGIRKIFALEDDFRVVAQAENLAQAVAAVQKFPTDILLFEVTLSSTAGEAITEIVGKSPNTRIIAVGNDIGEHDTCDFLRRGVTGILSRSVSPDLLVRCIRKVHSGETWLDNRGVNWVIEAYRAQAAQLMAPRNQPRLSEKELQIIAGVTQGMKNKDIAHEIGTTEQVVKNYLRKVYDKLGVSDRLELALYCMHHRLLEKARGAVIGTGEQPKPSVPTQAQAMPIPQAPDGSKPNPTGQR